MKTAALLAATLALGLTGTAHAQPMRADPYGDATVSRADAQTKAAADFAKLDANHDGFLTEDELTGPQSPGGGRFGAMLLRFADTNGDGKLSKDEFTAPAMQRFDRTDANHDGQLTRAERDAQREAMRQRFQGMGSGAGGSPMGGGGGD